MKKRVTSDWMDGYIEGITLFAWWKDGVQYVGITGKTLVEAIGEVMAEHPIETDRNHITEEFQVTTIIGPTETT